MNENCNCLYNGKTFDCPIHSHWAIKIKKLQNKLDIAKECLEFYANAENWTRRDTLFWENIDRDDCADYPHITRDIRLTGGKRAREAIKLME